MVKEYGEGVWRSLLLKIYFRIWMENEMKEKEVLIFFNESGRNCDFLNYHEINLYEYG